MKPDATSHSTASSLTARKIPAPQEPSASPWIDRHGLAKFFNVSVRTVDGWTAQNLVPFRRLGRRIVFSVQRVEAVLSAFDVNSKHP
jgi:hypothetical protein